VLPRKFKIAFEGCTEDHAKTSIHDIGWRASIQGGQRGFRMAVGGGTAIMCTSGSVIFEFLPAAEMFNAAEAVVRVFHKYGDYQHKARNRLKFMVKSMTWEKFRDEVIRTYEEVRAQGGVKLPFDPEAPPVEQAPDWDRPEPPAVEEIARRVMAAQLSGPGIHPETRPVTSSADAGAAFAQWSATNARPQKQDGYVTVVVTIPLGDFTGQQMRVLADLSHAYSDGSARVTVAQDIVFRWVPVDAVPEMYRRLAAAGLGLSGADTISDVTSCPGAESCKLAVTQSRGLGRTIEEFLRSAPELADLAADLDIKVSGCPNGCGQHHIAGIGFQGSLRKVEGRAVPQYFVMIGGGCDHDAASFGRVVAKIPARRCTTAVERLLKLCAAERQPNESSREFFRRADPTKIKILLADLERMTADTASAEDYIDLAETKEFVPETMEGECAS